MFQRGIMQNLSMEGLNNLSGRQPYKSSVMLIGRISEKMTPKFGFKGCTDIDHEKIEI